MEEKRERKSIVLFIMLHMTILLYGVSMVYLFYKQTQWTDGAVFESDLPVHIRMIIEDGWYYSLTAFVYRFCYMLPFGDLAVSLFLSFCGTLSVYLTALLVKRLLRPAEDKALFFDDKALAAGLILNLVMPCYIKGIADGRYIGMESASIWHNSTYIVMKAVALICMLYYLKWMSLYREGLTVKRWLIFSVLLAVCTGIKPSFLVVFAPVMALFLLLDWIKGTPFKRVFIFGSTVFLSLLVILFQNWILFGGSTGNGWKLAPGHVISQHSGYPLISAVLSALFPLLVLLGNFSALKKERWFLGAWLMAGVGFSELFLFSETGNRAGDGNFMWGYSFALLLIFTVSLVKWIERVTKIFRGKNQAESGKKTGKAEFLALIVTGCVLLYHLYCGVYFYLHLLQGVSYWMWD